MKPIKTEIMGIPVVLRMIGNREKLILVEGKNFTRDDGRDPDFNEPEI